MSGGEWGCGPLYGGSAIPWSHPPDHGKKHIFVNQIVRSKREPVYIELSSVVFLSFTSNVKLFLYRPSNK